MPLQIVRATVVNGRTKTGSQRKDREGPKKVGTPLSVIAKIRAREWRHHFVVHRFFFLLSSLGRRNQGMPSNCPSDFVVKRIDEFDECRLIRAFRVSNALTWS